MLHILRIFSLGLLIVCAPALIHADVKPLAETAIEGTQQFIYRTVEDRDLSIFATKADNSASAAAQPAIVFFHGGGWVGGKPGQFTPHARHFSKRGIVCFQVEYRLLKKSKDKSPLACIQDARAALRWVREHAKQFNVDPHRIASAGGSAGGHLAACLGTAVTDQAKLFGDDEAARKISPRSNAMLLFNPVYDNGPQDGWGTKRVGEDYPKFSPAHNIDAKTPPAIVFLGDSDKLIPVSVAERFRKKMQQEGVESRLTIFPGMPHGFFNEGKYDNKPYLQTIKEADQFLKDLGWLK